MHQFLKTLPDALIGVVALFSWVPMVWVAFKLIEWRRERAEKRLEKLQDEYENSPAWKKTPDYWEKAHPSTVSDETDRSTG